MGRARPRVVVDTGVLVSAFAFGGTPARAVRLVVAAADIHVSPDLLEEYRAVPRELRASGKIRAPQFEDLVSGIASFVVEAIVAHPRKRLRVSRDPDDDVLLECCLAANTNYLTTGDRDLLEISAVALEKVGLSRLQILSPAATVRALS